MEQLTRLLDNDIYLDDLAKIASDGLMRMNEEERLWWLIGFERKIEGKMERFLQRIFNISEINENFEVCGTILVFRKTKNLELVQNEFC